MDTIAPRTAALDIREGTVFFLAARLLWPRRRTLGTRRVQTELSRFRG
ncbi:hypothetical protein [Peterkaempfera sp. SMS 1(5)a]